MTYGGSGPRYTTFTEEEYEEVKLSDEELKQDKPIGLYRRGKAFMTSKAQSAREIFPELF